MRECRKEMQWVPAAKTGNFKQLSKGGEVGESKKGKPAGKQVQIGAKERPGGAGVSCVGQKSNTRRGAS